MSYALIATIVGTTIVSIIIVIHRKITYWSRHGVNGLTFLQSLSQFGSPIHISDLVNYKKFGPIFGYYGVTDKSIVVNDPELIRDILVKDFHIFPNHREAHWGDKRFAMNLFSIHGDDDWKRIRSVISPAFSSGKLKIMTESISDLSDVLVENIREVSNTGKEFDMKVFINGFVMDVITSCVYGINTDSIRNPNHPIVVNAKHVFSFDPNISTFMCFLMPQIAKFLKLNFIDLKILDFFEALTKRLIEERKKQNKDNPNVKKRTDFLQIVMDSCDDINDNDDEKPQKNMTKEKKTLTMDELMAQAMLFFLAGHDTSGATLAHTFYYLTKYPNVQEKLFKELSSINEITPESLAKLKYLDAVIFETLRLAPPFLRVERSAIIDYELGNTGITVPKGTNVTFLPYALQRDPKYFDDPETFNPERFIDESHHPYAFIPFGGGPRLCLGMRFAMINARMCIVKLVRNFRFSISPDFTLEYFISVAYNPKEVKLFAEIRQ